MLGIIPPTGGKIGVAEIAAGLSAMLSGRDVPLRLAGIEAPLLGVSSGRAALSAVLQSMARLRPGRDTVIIPAYTCYSVAAAVVHAGLKIKLVDVDPLTLAMDAAALQRECDERVLAVVHTELFGLIGAIPEYAAIAAKAGAYLLEDSAQAYGSSLHGKMAGTLGDVGIFSVGRGKPICGMTGGIIVPRRPELSEEIHKTIAAWHEADFLKQVSDLAKLCVYRVCFHPAIYRVLESVPALKIGCTEYEPAFPTLRLAPSQCRTAAVAARRSIQERQERNERARCLMNSGERDCVFVFPGGESREVGNVPRLPVLAPDASARQQTIAGMRALGIGASTMYPKALCCLEELHEHRTGEGVHCAGAEDVARRLFTLPVHELVGQREIARMRDVLYTQRARDSRELNG